MKSAAGDRLARIDWAAAGMQLDAYGVAVLPGLLSPHESDAVGRLWETADFRKEIVMARHGYGRGAYRYFAYPLPPLIEGLREGLYARLAPIANGWRARLGSSPFPATLAAFLERCHAAGQTRPTPLLLDYGEGDYNRLHQDLYGEHAFPLQATLLLSAPGKDFTGGEFVVTEQRPRRQSRVEALPLGKGDAVVFAVNDRPAPTGRGRLRMRHGVSTVRSGHRRTLGIIFHDAA
ncbi:MAG TPA: 2OG-Fe(II) oxygenase [Caulobacteraceae bacterium]|nr:2OG-Fe(II) oxygenase [Caulobacteraceae bacterium]